MRVVGGTVIRKATHNYKTMLLLVLCLLVAVPIASQAQGSNSASLEALVKAAQAEGEVSFSAVTENVAKRTADAFSAKYGLKYTFIRLAGVALERRFGSEAEAGIFAADFYMVSTAVPFAEDAIRKGWAEPIAQAGIPSIVSGEFPAKFVTGPTAIVQVAPWGIAYHSDRVKGADIPRDWPAMLNPKFKGQILVPDPRSANSYPDHWGAIIDRYGEEFLVKLREMNLRQYPSGVPSTNALGAGEGALQVPAVAAQISAIKDKGAPIDIVIPAYTSGVEIQFVLTHRSKAKHPASARLFANFIMTPEGNKIFNSEPGSISVFDTVNMPKEYVSPKRGALARRDLITRLLGFPL